VALIGCGQIGWKYDDLFLVPGNFSHAAAVAANPGFCLAAVCDNDPESAKECARRYRVAGQFSSTEEMLVRGPFDVVVIATPPASHLAILKTVLAVSVQPKVIVLEKPLAIDLQQAREMVELGEISHCKIVLNYSRRFSPEIASGLAKFVDKECRFSGLYSGGLISNGTHWFDMLQMAGFRAREVRAIPPVVLLPGDDFQVDVILRSESGSSAILQMLPAGFPSVFEFTAMSRNSKLNITDLGLTLEDSSCAPSLIVKGATNYLRGVRRVGDVTGNLDRLYENVAGIIQGSAHPVSNTEHGLHPLEIAFAAKESAERDGVPINLP